VRRRWPMRAQQIGRSARARRRRRRQAHPSAARRQSLRWPASSGGFGRGGAGSRARGTPPSDHDTSAGARAWPPGPAAGGDGEGVGHVGADLVGLGRPADERRNVAGHRLDVGLELASNCLWYVAWCRDVDDRSAGLAGVVEVGEAVAQPGPECSSVAAGRPAMRPKPSAAPVATPSNSASTLRISGTASRAATKCISDVPGFHDSTCRRHSRQRADQRLATISLVPHVSSSVAAIGCRRQRPAGCFEPGSTATAATRASYC